MLLSRKQEISLEIEKLLADLKMLEAYSLSTDNCISQISKLLREYTDLYRMEKQLSKIRHYI